MQEISALEENIGSYQQSPVKYLPFPHTGISLLTKNLAHIKVYTYFNIGDAKTLAKLKKKYSKLPKTCSYPLLSTNFLDFFASLVLNFSQVSKTLGYRDKFWTKQVSNYVKIHTVGKTFLISFHILLFHEKILSGS